MSGLYAGNLLLSMQGIDNTTGLTVFNHMVSNTSITGLNGCTFSAASELLPGTYILYGSAVQGVYIKNLSPVGAGNLVITWDAGGGQVPVISLLPGELILVFTSQNPTTIFDVTLNVATIAIVEYAMWY